METLISLLGIGILFGLGILLSFGRHQINWRTVGFALLLQFALGGIALYFPLGVAVLEAISNAVSSVLNNAQDGIDFVFGSIGAFEMGFIFAFHVLPVIVFFSSLVSVLYHLGILGWLSALSAAHFSVYSKRVGRNRCRPLQIFLLGRLRRR